jgi:transcriptional regulator with XRE-family HTH domain
MSGEVNELPFKSLGIQLKVLRQKLQETMAEVAGAVEIEIAALEHIEQGSERPSEDILMLLITHFDIHEDEATNLWLLAGYDQPQDKETEAIEETTNRPVVVMMSIDTRILYSDQTQVTADKSGVVLNFMQASSILNGKPQQLPVARVGMSYEQAHELLHILQTTLLQADNLRRPKGLPAPKTGTSQSSLSKRKKTDTN